jgi:mannonate dehydratase
MATGLGDAALNGRERVVVAKPTEHVVRLLIGKDAHRIEKMWQFPLSAAPTGGGAR